MDQKTSDRIALAKTKIQRYWATLDRQNHFQIFGADRDTDPERIKAAYHQLAKLWHTDAYAGVNLGAEQEILDAIFKRITDAYETVMDPKKRAEYLVLLDRQARGLSTDVNAILQAEGQFDDALVKIRRRDWPGAKTGLQEAMKQNPDDPLMPVHYAWVVYNMAKDRKEGAQEALELLKKVIKQHENSPLAYQYLGTIYFQLEKPAEAKRAWRLCLEWEPTNVEAQRGVRLVNQREQQAKQDASGLGGFMKKLFKRS
jgi:curved DNA-binding protein CbpA